MIIELETDDVKLYLLTLGASVYKLETKDKYGNFDNIILTHKNIKSYYNGNDGYLGATCGRVAGRILNGKFKIDEDTFELNKNYKQHTHHGGEKGLSSVEWDYEIVKSRKKQCCIFSYKSKHLENGFPGNVELKCEYILENNKLTINYYGTSDRKTFLNLTNHTYFNLSKNDDLHSQKLYVNSKDVVLVNEDVLPLEIVNVENTEFDFNVERNLSILNNITMDSLLYNQNGIDNTFIINKNNQNYDLILSNEQSGRNVKIKSTYPTIVLYTYNFPVQGELLNRENKCHIALAIEPQYAPNAMNDIRFNIPIVDVNNPYKESIIYLFNEN